MANVNTFPILPVSGVHQNSYTQNILTRKPAWDLVDALKGGTAAMQLAREKYLPKDAKERKEVYETRLSRSVLDNFYLEAINRSVDKIFSKDITLTEQPTVIEFFWNDVDAAGRDGNQFCKETLTNAIQHGVSFILTDYTALPEQGFKNRAAELAAEARPYWVQVTCPMVIALNSELIQGREQLNLFSYQTEVTVLVDNEYLSTIETRTFKLKDNLRVSFEVQQLIKGDWITKSSGDLPEFIRGIPITCIYAHREGFFIGSPLFMTLAELQVQHFQKRSDLENILHIANVPFLFGKGFSNPLMDTQEGRPNGMKAGPRRNPDGTSSSQVLPKLEVDIHNAIMSSNPGADIRYVEHTGSAISVALKDLERLENRMRDLGNSLFTSQTPGDPTATGKAINAAEANARLKSLALALQDALEMALVYVSAYLKEPVKPNSKLEVNTSYSTEFVAESTFTLVMSLYREGLIDHEALVSEAKRRNILALDLEVLNPMETVEPEVLPEGSEVTEETQEDQLPNTGEL